MTDRSTGTATTHEVGPVTATVTALNYKIGTNKVDGLWVGSDTVLTFPEKDCSPSRSFSAVGDVVTYSGIAVKYPTGFQSIRVTNFSVDHIVYSPPTKALQPVAYELTEGKIAATKRDPHDGSVIGFMFRPKTGKEVFVDTGSASGPLAQLLTNGKSISVVGTLSPSCVTNDAVHEVDASSVIIDGSSFAVKPRT